jgi:hypothetical protein
VSENTNREVEKISQQLYQLAREGSYELIKRLTQASIEYHESKIDYNPVLHIKISCQERRNECISVAESLADIYLKNCSTFSINPDDNIYFLKQAIDKLIEDTYSSLKSHCGYISIGLLGSWEKYFYEEEGEIRPYLERRILEIISAYPKLILY